MYVWLNGTCNLMIASSLLIWLLMNRVEHVVCIDERNETKCSVLCNALVHLWDATERASAEFKCTPEPRLSQSYQFIHFNKKKHREKYGDRPSEPASTTRAQTFYTWKIEISLSCWVNCTLGNRSAKRCDGSSVKHISSCRETFIDSARRKLHRTRVQTVWTFAIE